MALKDRSNSSLFDSLPAKSQTKFKGPTKHKQDIATLLVAACCARLATLLRLVATCCNMLVVVGSCWLKFENGQNCSYICGCCMMFYSFGQVRATMLRPRMRTSSNFHTQHATTRRNRVATARNMLHPTMLRYVGLKCCDCLAGACKCRNNNVGI